MWNISIAIWKIDNALIICFKVLLFVCPFSDYLNLRAFWTKKNNLETFSLWARNTLLSNYPIWIHKSSQQTTPRLSRMLQGSLWSWSASVRLCQTASYIQTVGEATTFWISQISTTSASTILIYSLTAITISIASRISGTKRNGICANSMVFPRINLVYVWMNVSGGLTQWPFKTVINFKTIG